MKSKIQMHLLLATVTVCLRFTTIHMFTPSAVGPPDLNITATKGRKAELPCTIDSKHTRNVSVVWMDQHDNVLFYDDVRIIDDQRFTLLRHGRKWDLIIDDVDERDQGRYRCVANTSPIKLKYYELVIFVPAKIVVEDSTPDTEVNEGTTVRLFCNATGYPEPTVSWSVRRANESANSTNIQEIEKTGAILQVQSVTKYLDDIYTCTARNGFGVPHSHDIRIRVRFKPSVRIAQKRVSHYKGLPYTITCEATGYRKPKVYFAKDNQEIKEVNGGKYQYIQNYTSDGYGVRVMLYINKLEAKDFGYYKCVAINTLGRAEQFIELIEQKFIWSALKTTTVGNTTPELEGNSNYTTIRKSNAGKGAFIEIRRPRKGDSMSKASQVGNDSTRLRSYLPLLLSSLVLLLTYRIS